MNKHDLHCREIAETLEKYASGEYFLFDGELYPIDSDEEFWSVSDSCCFGLEDDGFYYYYINGEKIEESEVEAASIYDFFDDNIYNINYILDSNKELEAVRVMIACGGPNIFIDTWDKEVQLRWWSECGSWYLTTEMCDSINTYFNEVYFSQGRGAIMTIEKYIDLTEHGADYDLKAALAYGWKIKHQGLTLIILEMEV